MKKIISIVLALILVLGLAACTAAPAGNNNAGNENVANAENSENNENNANSAAADNTANNTENTAQSDGSITIDYPQDMKAQGFTEPLKLEKMPEKVVSMSTAPVLALNKLGVNFIAVPKTSVVEWPENMKDVELLNTAMNSNFDIETVIAMEPDLVILGSTTKDTYGVQLSDANIPVYYVSAGHVVSYDAVKSQTEELIKAFGEGTPAADELRKMFSDVEALCADTSKKLDGKSVMVLQSAPPNHYIQTKGGTLGTMANMLGLENVYENDASSMAQIDYEQALDYDPDIVLATGMMPSGEGHKQVMEEDFAKNPEYWNAIEAIKDGDVIYLPVSFTSTAGISIIDRINELNDMLLDHFGLK